MQQLIKNTQAYRLLQAERAKNRLSHAYLLLLDDKRNLRNALKTFAKVIFGCDTPRTDAERRLAERIDKETFSDCLFFPAADKKFVVEDAEKLTEECMLRPVEGDIKAFAIADFAEANIPSQNKLLKLLEEPPEDVVFLLGATTAFPVLPTVLSRVAKLEISPFDERDVAAALQRIYTDGKYTDNDFSLCAAASGGSVGEAQNTLEGGDYRALVDEAFALLLCTKEALPSQIKKTGETKRKKELLYLLRLIFRDALLQKTQADGKENPHILLRVENARLKRVAERFSLSTLLFAQNELSKAELHTFFNATFAQCLELLVAKIFENDAKARLR
ncbi:MAG: hypothetical protein E7355_02445 [Clostridiales bacterium]|nr:hypothetical protein [Clostridiales bacterium]